MDKQGLSEAIKAVGGTQIELARRIGVDQQVVWYWVHKAKCIPAEHVLKIEQVTGVSRSKLRPDLWPERAA